VKKVTSGRTEKKKVHPCFQKTLVGGYIRVGPRNLRDIKKLKKSRKRVGVKLKVVLKVGGQKKKLYKKAGGAVRGRAKEGVKQSKWEASLQVGKK